MEKQSEKVRFGILAQKIMLEMCELDIVTWLESTKEEIKTKKELK